MHLAIGHILNNNCYQIKKVIGQGGFAITYLADEIGYYRNTGFGDAVYVKSKIPEQVVIKELFYGEYCFRDKKTGLITISNSEKSEEFDKLVQNQLEEGKKLRTLNHPNIVRTRDIFKENETAYMVMDFVEGTDLEGLLEKQHKLPKDQALRYISQVLSALNHIHERNQVHLDIKPSNILIRKQTDLAVLIDFGASQSYSKEGKIEGRTSQLVVAMTKHYAPNEQGDIDNLKQFDATFDTYAAGATLYHLLTGQKPPLSSLLSTGREKLMPVTSFAGNEQYGDFIDSILSKAMAPMYNMRFKSARDFENLIQKDQNYFLAIQLIKDKITIGENREEVFKLIEATEIEFMPTLMLQSYKQQMLEEIEKEKNNLNFNLNLNNANYYFEQKNYNDALKYYTKAFQIQPENKELKEKVAYCREQVEIARQLEKIATLIYQAKKEIEENNLMTARYKLEQVLELERNNAEAQKLIEEINRKIAEENDITILMQPTKKPESADKNNLISKNDEKTVLISTKKEIRTTKEKKVLRQYFKVIFQKSKYGRIAMSLAFVLLALVLYFVFVGKSHKVSQMSINVTPESTLISATDTIKTVQKNKDENTRMSPTKNYKSAPSQQTENKKTSQSLTTKSTETPSDNNIESSEEPIAQVKKNTNEKLTINGHKYIGESRNGMPNGNGSLYFSFPDRVSKNDPKENQAEKGDYLKGRWNNGQLEFGTLFSSTGDKKATIVIGRF